MGTCLALSSQRHVAHASVTVPFMGISRCDGLIEQYHDGQLSAKDGICNQSFGYGSQSHRSTARTLCRTSATPIHYSSKPRAARIYESPFTRGRDALFSQQYYSPNSLALREPPFKLWTSSLGEHHVQRQRRALSNIYTKNPSRKYCKK